jgi:hypothetical protein
MLLLLFFLPLLFKDWQKGDSCCCCYIVYHYYLRFYRGYRQPKQHEPLLCQTLNSNGRQYNSNNMNHSSVIPKTVMVDNITTTTWTTPLSILSTITVLGMTEEWFILLLLYCLQLLFKVWQRSGSYCCCYNVYHYCFRFDRGVVHAVIVMSNLKQ